MRSSTSHSSTSSFASKSFALVALVSSQVNFAFIWWLSHSKKFLVNFCYLLLSFCLRKSSFNIFDPKSSLKRQGKTLTRLGNEQAQFINAVAKCHKPFDLINIGFSSFNFLCSSQTRFPFDFSSLLLKSSDAFPIEAQLEFV